MKLLFSDGILSNSALGAATHCLHGTSATSSTGTPPPKLSTGTNCLTFWQGIMPTNTEMNAFTNTSRSSDALLRFTGIGAFTISAKTFYANFGSVFGTILAEGTMTWFNFGNTDSAASRPPMLFGSVGLPGSNADLIVYKTGIVFNDLWLCTNLYFVFNNEALFV